jgi:hypothetical protein
MMVDWNKHEKRMMREFGVEPQPGSGSGWLKKEDGESDHFIVQLKSTQGKSMSMGEQDVKDLISHAIVSHKVPVFMNSIVGKRTMVSVPLEFLGEFVNAMKEIENGREY